jgi:tetratricopeptide (TPR) repeat protein
MPPDQQALATALQFHQSGQFERARQIYRQLLDADAGNPDLLNLLGAACINLNQWDEAAENLAEALRLNPDHHAAHDNLGVLLAKQNRFAEAIASFERSVAIQSGQALTWLNLGNARSRNGQADQAIDALEHVVRLAPDWFLGHAELAHALQKQNRLAEAVSHFGEAVRLKPHDAKAHFEHAAALALLGQTDAAMAAYRETLRLKPDSAEACVNLATLCVQRKQLDEAVDWFRSAIQLRPHFAEAYLNLGCALTQQKKLAEAAASLEAAIRLKPKLAEAYNNLGIVQAEEGRFADAEVNYRQALALRADNAEALYNLGIALLKQKMVASALEHFERALELRPDYAEAHHNRAAALLLSENFSEGFGEYEWRFRSRDYPGFRPRWPLWDGSPLAGRTVVLVAEQGLGDTLQFIRYAAVLKRNGAATVVVECPAVLHPILARTPGVDQWISPATSPDSPTPAADCCAPLLSLPHLLQTDHDTIPADVPYVFADPQLESDWHARLAGREGFKIGIVWQGNPNCPGDALRSIALSHFAPLAEVAGVTLVNLQKGPGVEQLTDVAEPWGILDFGEAVDSTAGPFMDTAAIMKNLDLVITSDTAAAHLAGALGVEVWLAVPFVPDWRWLLEGDDSPWYPTMRLFRQSEWNDWPGVFRRMAGQLEALVSAGRQAETPKAR